jgi:hypothetical protein
LERIFNLVGADVRGWFEEMPRRIRADGVDASLTSPEKPKRMMTPSRLRIEEHFRNSQCILCRSFSEDGEHMVSCGIVCMRDIYSIRAVRTLLRDSCGDYVRTTLAGPDRGKPIRNGASCMHDVRSIGAIGACEMRLLGLSMALSAKEG